MANIRNTARLGGLLVDSKTVNISSFSVDKQVTNIDASIIHTCSNHIPFPQKRLTFLLYLVFLEYRNTVQIRWTFIKMWISATSQIVLHFNIVLQVPWWSHRPLHFHYILTHRDTCDFFHALQHVFVSFEVRWGLHHQHRTVLVAIFLKQMDDYEN